jgi:hypothetical protein
MKFNKRILAGTTLVILLVVMTAVTTETWACTTSAKVQKGTLKLSPMDCQLLSVSGAVPGNTLAAIPGHYTVKNIGTGSGNVYASIDQDSIYVTKTVTVTKGKKTSKKEVVVPINKMDKYISIYISDVNCKYYPLYINGKPQRSVLISGKKLLGKGQSIYPKLKYTFTDNGKNQSQYANLTFHYDVDFVLKSSK